MASYRKKNTHKVPGRWRAYLHCMAVDKKANGGAGTLEMKANMKAYSEAYDKLSDEQKESYLERYKRDTKDHQPNQLMSAQAKTKEFKAAVAYAQEIVCIVVFCYIFRPT